MAEKVRFHHAQRQLQSLVFHGLTDFLEEFPELEIEHLSDEYFQLPSHRNMSGALQEAGTAIHQGTLAFRNQVLAATDFDVEHLHESYQQLLIKVAWYQQTCPTFLADFRFHKSCFDTVKGVFEQSFASAGAFIKLSENKAQYEEVIKATAQSLTRSQTDALLHIAATPVADDRWKAEHPGPPELLRACVRNLSIAVYEATGQGSERPSFELEFIHPAAQVRV